MFPIETQKLGGFLDRIAATIVTPGGTSICCIFCGEGPLTLFRLSFPSCCCWAEVYISAKLQARVLSPDSIERKGNLLRFPTTSLAHSPVTSGEIRPIQHSPCQEKPDCHVLQGLAGIYLSASSILPYHAIGQDHWNVSNAGPLVKSRVSLTWRRRPIAAFPYDWWGQLTSAKIGWEKPHLANRFWWGNIRLNRSWWIK